MRPLPNDSLVSQLVSSLLHGGGERVIDDRLAEGLVKEMRNSLPFDFVYDVLEPFVDPFISKEMISKQLSRLKPGPLKDLLVWFMSHAKPDQTVCWPSTILQYPMLFGDLLASLPSLLLPPGAPRDIPHWNGKRSEGPNGPHDQDTYRGRTRHLPASVASWGPGGDQLTPHGEDYMEPEAVSSDEDEDGSPLIEETLAPWDQYEVVDRSTVSKQPRLCAPANGPKSQYLAGPPVFYSGEKVEFMGGESITSEDATFWCVQVKSFSGRARCAYEIECTTGSEWRPPMAKSHYSDKRRAWRHACRDLPNYYMEPTHICLGRGLAGPTGPIECDGGSSSKLWGCVGERLGEAGGWFNSTAVMEEVWHDPSGPHDPEHK
ncbi:hypothetical protein CDD82_5551 [Ophiocordyceps australis]|uniref:Uncharacterized protein n=1 Tax=Ophiocordyceps australis TaxID=1399860 RepID=A0A2C5Z0Z3_9HYPO|nr:hypothetical protein CDD82_5551 [Ophiocordyceps australis]